MKYRCPVCFFDCLPYPPEDYHICLCCGAEFGNDDQEHSLEDLRAAWIGVGAPWFYEQPPLGWNPWEQLFDGGRADLIPTFPQVSLYNFDWQGSEANTIQNWMIPALDSREQLETVG